MICSRYRNCSTLSICPICCSSNSFLNISRTYFTFRICHYSKMYRPFMMISNTSTIIKSSSNCPNLIKNIPCARRPTSWSWASPRRPTLCPATCHRHRICLINCRTTYRMCSSIHFNYRSSMLCLSISGDCSSTWAGTFT